MRKIKTEKMHKRIARSIRSACLHLPNRSGVLFHARACTSKNGAACSQLEKKGAACSLLCRGSQRGKASKHTPCARRTFCRVRHALWLSGPKKVSVREQFWLEPVSNRRVHFRVASLLRSLPRPPLARRSHHRCVFDRVLWRGASWAACAASCGSCAARTHMWWFGPLRRENPLPRSATGRLTHFFLFYYD